MKLYWFSDENGHAWDVVAATCEENARRIAKKSADEWGRIMELRSTVSFDGNEGVVASFYTPECDFSIYESPGGELGYYC